MNSNSKTHALTPRAMDDTMAFIYLWLCLVFNAANGLSLVVVPGLLVGVASLVARAPGHLGSCSYGPWA